MTRLRHRKNRVTLFLFVRFIIPSKLKKKTTAGTQLVWTLGNSRSLTEKSRKMAKNAPPHPAPLESSNHFAPGIIPTNLQETSYVLWAFSPPPPSEMGFRPQVCRKNLQVSVWLVRFPLPNLAASGTRLGIFCLEYTPNPCRSRICVAYE